MPGKFLTGYDGKTAAPFNRFYMGGENDIRGFDIWGISPVAYVPSSAVGATCSTTTARRASRMVVDRSTGNREPDERDADHSDVPTGVRRAATWRSWANFEYRIPIFGPVTLALFLDAGLNRLVANQPVAAESGPISRTERQFPGSGFPAIARWWRPGTQALRMSTGLEIQVLMPVVNAPFRIYLA